MYCVYASPSKLVDDASQEKKMLLLTAINQNKTVDWLCSMRIGYWVSTRPYTARNTNIVDWLHENRVLGRPDLTLHQTQ